MKIIQLEINDIKPYWRNPRNNDKAIEAVKKSIQDYGFNTPLILDKDCVIIAGHTRYKALMQLGWKEVPCIIADITPAKAKEYRIADNKTSELATWDMDHLIPELREIDLLNDFEVYFPNIDLNQLLQTSSGGDYKNHTEEAIQTIKGELENRFTEQNDRVDYIETICPHCAEAYYLARNEIINYPSAARSVV